MQADGRLVASGQIASPRYRGLLDAFTTISKSEGAIGFYRGCWPAIQRAALVNLGELTTYDTAKKYLVGRLGDTTLCHVCAAVCSGFVASLCSTPADVAKSRIMGQVPLPDGTLPYRGTLDCWRKVLGKKQHNSHSAFATDFFSFSEPPGFLFCGADTYVDGAYTAALVGCIIVVLTL